MVIWYVYGPRTRSPRRPNAMNLPAESHLQPPPPLQFMLLFSQLFTVSRATRDSLPILTSSVNNNGSLLHDVSWAGLPCPNTGWLFHGDASVSFACMFSVPFCSFLFSSSLFFSFLFFSFLFFSIRLLPFLSFSFFLFFFLLGLPRSVADWLFHGSVSVPFLVSFLLCSSLLFCSS